MASDARPPAPAEVVVVGSLNVDLVVAVDHRPAPGETVLGGDVATHPGGKGANQAVAAARLGGRVAMLGCVGDDPHGELLLSSLRSAGVDDRHVRRLADVPSGIATITVTPDGQNAIVVSPGANARLGATDVLEARSLLAGARVVVAQLEVPLAVVERAAAAAAGVTVVLNAAPAQPLPATLLKRVDVLVVNEQEAGVLLEGEAPDAEDAEDAARRLLGLGPRAAVITLGAGGAVHAADDGRAGHVPTSAVSVVDTTGAGDAFVGALALALARDAGLDRATGRAVRAGTVATRREGAQPSFPTTATLEIA